MLNIIMLILLLAVIATSIGVFFWFTRRLDTIEEELWGDKKREAEKTAKDSADKDKSDKNTPEQ
jgi:flagellar basal body-associated protein FliL